MEEKDEKKKESQELSEKDLEQAAGGFDRNKRAKVIVQGGRPPISSLEASIKR